MVEPMRRMVERAHFAKRVLMKQGEENRVSFSMTLTECPISDEQMGKLLEILDKAAMDAAAVMDWQ